MISNTMAIVAVVVGGAVGLMIAKMIIPIMCNIIRATDKRRIKTAMTREAYLNQLYEEALYEDVDRMTKKTARCSAVNVIAGKVINNFQRLADIYQC